MPGKRSTKGYDERLKRALEESGHGPDSVRGLADYFKKPENKQKYKDLRGTSYGGIRQYAEGIVKEPRVDLLQVFAEVLGVRWEWLAFGEGGMTQSEEENVHSVAATLTRVAVASALATSSATISIPKESPFKLVVDDVMKPVFDRLKVPEGSSPAWVGGLVSVWRELTESGLEGMGQEYKQIAKALCAPIKELGVKLEEMPEDVLNAYVFGAIPGLMVLAREASDQRDEAG